MLGEVIIEHPISAQIWFFVFSVITALFIIFLILGNYSRKERFLGYVVPEKGLINVYLDDAATVTDVFVEGGQFVHKDGPLVAIESDRSLETKSDVNKYIIEFNQTQIENANHQKDLIKKTFGFRNDILQKNIEALAQQMVLEERRKVSQAKRIQRVEEKYLDGESIHSKGFISDDDLAVLQDNLLSEQMTLNQINQSILALEIRKREALSQLDTNHLEELNQLNTIEGQIAQMEQQILLQKNQIRSIVTAPIDGTVTSLQAANGMRMTNQHLVLAILPENSDLSAEIFIPTRSIGFLKEGMGVDIRYDTFPHEKYGSYRGIIKQISKTAILPNQITDPIFIQEPVYKAKVGLENDFIHANGFEYKLQPGMTFVADVSLDKRPLYQWLFRPLIDVMGRM